MSGPFTSWTNLKRLAQKRAEQQADYLEQYYQRAYGRPAFSGRFEDRSEAAWHLEWFTGIWRQRSEIERSLRAQRELGADNQQVKARMKTAYQHLRAIDELFGTSPVSDDLISQWDRQLRDGQAPDLRQHFSKLKMSDRLRAQLEQASQPQRS